jgi:hypothetical protein
MVKGKRFAAPSQTLVSCPRGVRPEVAAGAGQPFAIIRMSDAFRAGCWGAAASDMGHPAILL